jgi:tRNA pseudouridine38-40 synthase
LTTILRSPTEIVGCGRTDAGVHALQYYAHFDSAKPIPDKFVYALNALLKRDIAIYRCIPVEETAHARFDASARSYIYHIDICPNPFRQETAFYFPHAHKVDTELMQAAAQLLLEYKEFDTFCKTGTDANTRLCDLRVSEWTFLPDRWAYRVTSDRFLRGMIRLIVGMCLNVGTGKLTLTELRAAMDQRLPLAQALSAPPEGLFLLDIHYPYIH